MIMYLYKGLALQVCILNNCVQYNLRTKLLVNFKIGERPVW